MARPVHVGCSGWNYRDWREPVYGGLPANRWLERYGELFSTVEVNATFYRLQRPEAVARWVEQTPAGFVFAVKASRYLSHIKRLRGIGEGVRRFMETIEPLARGGKLGPILWQFPENFHRDDDRLAKALPQLPEGRHCFEFRHASWFADEVYELLRAHDVALVIGDDPERPFQSHEITTDWTYVRFHRGNRGRRGNYSHTELDAWAERINGWRQTYEVFAFFNNDWEAFAPRNARGLAERTSG